MLSNTLNTFISAFLLCSFSPAYASQSLDAGGNHYWYMAAFGLMIISLRASTRVSSILKLSLYHIKRGIIGWIFMRKLRSFSDRHC